MQVQQQRLLCRHNFFTLRDPSNPQEENSVIAREIGLLYAGAGEEVGRVLVTGNMIFIDNFTCHLTCSRVCAS